jgi:YVTN family beta-propeller protein
MKVRFNYIRLLSAIAIAVTPLASLEACSGASDGPVANTEVDAATDDETSADASTMDGADAISDASKKDARATSDGAITVEQNQCGGHGPLVIDGKNVTPGNACGSCDDGTIACIGPDLVECAGASAIPCAADASTPDAGLNACGGSGSLTSAFGVDASVNDSCGGGCGQLQCATRSTLVCLLNGTCAADAGVAGACSIPDSAYTASPAPLPAESRPSASLTLSLALPTFDFAFNARDGYLYASVDGSSTIAVIDPMTATIVASIYVGLSPTQLSVSDDGEVLWVAISTPPSIRRVDLLTRTAGSSILLPASSSPYSSSVLDLEVLPGSHDAVAATYYSPVSGLLTVVFDGAMPRPYGSSTNYGDVIIPTASPSLLYVSGYGYDTVAASCLDQEGIFTSPFAYYNSAGYNDSVPAFSSGKIFMPLGDVLDGKTGSLLGTIALPDVSNNTYIGLYNGLAADSQDAYFLTNTMETEGTFNSVLAADQATLTTQGPDLIDLQTYRPSHLVRWGRYGLAFLTQYTGIVIARSTLIPDSP